MLSLQCDRTSGFIRERIKTYGVLWYPELNLLTSNPCAKRLETMLCIYTWSMVKVDISMFKPGEWYYMVGEY